MKGATAVLELLHTRMSADSQLKLSRHTACTVLPHMFTALCTRAAQSPAV
jgi:hypothetical protein